MRNSAIILVLVLGVTAQAAEQANIIIYMVDDLGWNHIGVKQATMGTHGEQYATPHLARLAKEGLSFTHAYAQPNCAPTRAAMLTGQYPARIHNDVYVVGNLNRNGKGGISKDKAKFIGPQQSEDVAPQAITIAEALKKNGYATAHIGKYHVGGHRGEATMPENAGFAINIGGYSQGHQPSCFATKAEGGWKFKGVGLGHFDRFGTPYSEAYVMRRALPAELVGTPKHISDAVGDALEETVGKLHATGKPFYLQFHTYAVHGPVRARPDLKKAFQASDAKQAEYLGFIAGVDENLKRMLDLLDDPNRDGDTSDSIAEDTVVFFTSDNGGTHADNLPLKGKKGMLTEGGIRVPLIARWPGTIPAGTVSHRKIHCIDFYSTCLQLAGNKWRPPRDQHPLDSDPFAHVLRNPDTTETRDPIFYLFPGYLDSRAQPSVVAIADGGTKRYKIYYYYESDAWELYCLSDDTGETNNLIDEQPEIASELSKRIHAWLTQKHPTWKPKYPIVKTSGKPAGPPPLFLSNRESASTQTKNEGAALSGTAMAQAENSIGKPEVPGGDSNSSGFTPLHEAARVGSLETAKRLLGKGANVNARVSIAGVLDPNYDFVDDTPIDIAAAFGHSDFVKLLRKYGGVTATEIEATRVKSITWGKPVDGLQIGVAFAIEENTSDRHPTYLEAYVRNSGAEPRTLLTSVHTGLDGGPEKSSLLASRLTLYKLGGGDLITLFYQGDNHLLLPRARNRKSNELGPGTLGKHGDSYTIAALSDEDARKRSITLAPGQQIGPVSIRYRDTSSWAPAYKKAWPDRKSQYGVALMLDINHPKSPWKGTLTTAPLPRLRFIPPLRDHQR